jgi:hypothetical protein
MGDSDKPMKSPPDPYERYHDFMRRMLDSVLDEKKVKKSAETAK